MRLRSVGDDTPVPPAAARGDRIASPIDGIGRSRDPQLLDATDARIDPLVVAAFYPDDPVAEAARQVRGQLAAARRADGVAVRLVALIGIDAQAETAVIAANAAVVCAQAGYRTLLIDAAIDTPTQHRLFQIGNGAGVTSLLVAEDMAGTAIRPTAVPGLSVLPAGPDAPNGDQLFDRARLFERIRGPIERFDMTLMLAPGDAAIATAASEGCDGVIVVVRRAISASRTLQDLIARLDERGTPVIGVIQVD